MDSKLLINSFSSQRNKEYQWFLVQYDKNPQKFIRKIVRYQDIIWNENLQTSTNETNSTQQQQQQQKEHVLIRDKEQLFLGYIISKSIDFKDILGQQNYLQLICVQLLHSFYELNNIMERLHFNHNFWLLVMYSTAAIFTAPSSIYGDQSVFGVFHKNDVVLKRENQSKNIVAYVQEQESTFKGIILKVTNDFSEIMFTLDIVKNDVVKMFKEHSTMDHEKRNQEIQKEIKQMEQQMYKETKLLLQAFQTIDKSKTRLKQRLIYLQNLKKMNDNQMINNMDTN